MIASNVQGLKDSVMHGQTGVLVEPKNTDEFTKAMVDIITDEAYRNFLSKSAYIWSQNFGWDTSAEHFHNIMVNSMGKRYQYKLFRRIALAKDK